MQYRFEKKLIKANSLSFPFSLQIAQIAKILNAHMNSLQWIEQNSGFLQRKVDEIARLSETRRKEQERNFRLAFD
ncbi:Nuclear pore glycoprotein p62 [Porites harrisoni]